MAVIQIDYYSFSHKNVPSFRCFFSWNFILILKKIPIEICTHTYINMHVPVPTFQMAFTLLHAYCAIPSRIVRIETYNLQFYFIFQFTWLCSRTKPNLSARMFIWNISECTTTKYKICTFDIIWSVHKHIQKEIFCKKNMLNSHRIVNLPNKTEANPC